MTSAECARASGLKPKSESKLPMKPKPVSKPPSPTLDPKEAQLHEKIMNLARGLLRQNPSLCPMLVPEQSELIGEEIEQSELIGEEIEQSRLIGEEIEQSRLIGEGIKQSGLIS